MKILTLGPDGSYSSQVAKSIHPSPHIEYSESNLETIKKLKKADIGIVPIHNKYGGVVGGNMEALVDVVEADRHIRIVGFYSLQIRHVLASRTQEGIERIQRVYSHPQALKQCKGKLSSMRKVEEIQTPSTTYQIEKLTENEAVICGLEAANKAGLHILSNQFCPPDNTTHFALFSSLKNLDIRELNCQQDRSISIVKAPIKVFGAVFNIFQDMGFGVYFLESVANRRGGMVFPVVSDAVGNQKKMRKEIERVGGSIKFL